MKPMRDFAVVCWPNTVRKFNLIAFLLLSLTAHADINFFPIEELTQENAVHYCRDLGMG